MARTPGAERSNRDDATTNPTSSNDATEGWDVGSRWVNTTNGTVWFAVDVTAGAAIWKDVSTPGAGSHPVYVQPDDPDQNDDSNAGFNVGDHWINSTTKEIFQLADSTIGAAIWQVVSRRKVWDAIVAPSGGDYTLPSAAFAAGHKRVWMRNSTYVETADVVIPDGGHLASEAGTVIDFGGGAFQVVADGSGGAKETTGTFAVTSGSSAVVGTGTVFTNLSPGDWLFIVHAAYQIDTITDNLNLTLVDTWEGPNRSGLTMLASSLYSEIVLQEFDIKNSTVASGGLYLRGCRRVMVRNVDVEDCTHNVIIEDCESVATDNLISHASANDGVRVLSSFNLRFDKSRSYGNAGNGLVVNGGGYQRFDSTEVSGNGLAGIRVENGATDVGLNGCIIEENSGIGVDGVAGTARIQIYGGEIERNGSHGINTVGAECSATANEVVGNGGHGIAVGDGGLIVGNHIDSNASHGISLSSASNSVITTNDIYINGGDGVLFASSDDVTVAANRIRGNTGNGITIPATGVSRSRLFSNNASGNAIDYSIAVGVGADTTIFSAEYTGTDLTGPVLHNTSGIAPPDPTDDRASGYQKGSVWLDTIEKDVYICIDSTATAAKWVQINFSANQSRDTPKEAFYGSLLDYPVSAGNTSGEVQYVRIWLQAQFEFTQMRCFVDAGGTAARSVRMGLYDQADPEDPNLPPRNLVASTLSSPTGGDNGLFKTVPLQSIYVVPNTGYYWIAIVQDSSSLKLASSATFRADFLPVRRESGSGTNLPSTAVTLTNPVSALIYVAAVEA